jgi:hypothetical protein
MRRLSRQEDHVGPEILDQVAVEVERHATHHDLRSVRLAV